MDKLHATLSQLNPSEKREGGHQASHLPEKLLAIHGYWERKVFFKNVASGNSTMLHPHL
jgi:primosomal protein N''